MTDEHRVTITPGKRRVRASLGGVTIADSAHALTLLETGYPPVVYFPIADVKQEFLTPTDRRTRCPYKGEASYWTVSAGGEVAGNAAWGYPNPIPDAAALKDHVAFYADRIDHRYEDDSDGAW